MQIRAGFSGTDDSTTLGVTSRALLVPLDVAPLAPVDGVLPPSSPDADRGRFEAGFLVELVEMLLAVFMVTLHKNINGG
jgi:hypothetical protein